MGDRKIILLGAGGHARVIIDILTLSGWVIAGVVDKIESGKTEFLGYPVIGNDDVLKEIYEGGVRNAVLGMGHIGNYIIRNNIYCKLKGIGYQLPNIIHPNATIASDVAMGEGNVIFAGSVINSGAVIGNIDIINTNVVIEHEVKIGNNVHVAPGGVILGAVSVMNNSFIGANSTVLQGRKVGRAVIIGAGSTVLKDVGNDVTVVGNPARIVGRR